MKPLVLCCSVLLALLASPAALRGQVTVAPDVVTDSIDVFADSQKGGASRAAAGFFSLVVPGLGHQYLGNNSRALAYFSAEALFICGMIFCERYSKRMFEDTRGYAWLYAGAQGGSGANDYFWQNVGRFMDRDEYNRIMELNRTPEDKYTAGNLSWRWIDEFYMDEYNGLRETATRFHVVSSFFLGAMVLNRVVAFVDIRRSTKYKGVQGHANLEFLPQYRPATGQVGLALTRDF